VKNLFILCGLLFAIGCSSSKTASSNTGIDSRTKRNSIEFIDGISTQANPEAHYASTPRISENPNNHSLSPSANIENFSSLRFKYAILTDVNVEELGTLNLKLLSFIEEWYGTRYHYGGNSKDGIDCSGFVSLLLSSVYSVNNLPRTSKEQFESCKRLRQDELREGDLVFFHTQKNVKHKQVTHVGVYLLNHRFIHASVSGVMISDMGTGYYSQHYVGGGRVIW
jgi:cell wall-associated NlpC family hydrolase